MDFARVRQFADGGVNRRENAVGQNPHDRRRAQQRHDGLHHESRSNEARANAATPRGVMGSQAKAGSVNALTRSS